MAQAAVLRAHTKAQQKGSDPRLATCRGKLQSKRSKLNQEINKELRLRAGAENLFKATNNRKLKETVALELSFVNSNLQLLKEQLAELNSSVEIYQGESAEPVMPMIPLGLKETKEIDFTDPFKDFILEHYSEEGQKYEGKIREFMDLRQAMRCPHRDNTGVSILFEYYNQLYFVERRFFPPDRSLGIYFEWFDSLTGVPSSQRTVAFEKACVLFNLSALYTQLGAKQPRNCPKGLDQSIDYFLRAAGCLGYLRDNFTNGPSIDLAQDMLNMLVHLMLGQARECLVEKLQLQSKEQRGDPDIYFDLALEAQEVSSCYGELADALMPSLSDYLPYSWISLCSVKREFYWSVASLYVAKGLRAAFHRSGSHDGGESRADQLVSLIKFEVDYGSKRQQHSLLRSAYLNKATTCHEEAARLQRMCRELRAKHCLTRVLNQLSAAVETEERKELGQSSTGGGSRLETSGAAGGGRGVAPKSNNNNNNSLSDLIEPVKLPGNSKFTLRPTSPDFGQTSVKDIFHELGPLAVFSAKNRWSPPRSVMLRQRASGGGGGGVSCSTSSSAAAYSSTSSSSSSPHSTGATCPYGFSITTDSPTVVTNVQSNSLAAVGGMKEGDFIVAINDIDVKWSTHDQVVALIKKSRGELNLKIVTPCLMKRTGGGSRGGGGSSSTSSVKAVSEEKLIKKDVKKSPSTSSTKVSGLIKTPKHLSTSAKCLVWNPFKQSNNSQSTGKISFNSNVILR